MNKPCQILIVEDDYLTQLHLRDLVEDFGYSVCGAADNAADAVKLVMSEHPHALLMDVRLKGQRDGVDAALEIYDKHAVPVIFITGSNEPKTIERIKQDHPSALLIKPVAPARLRKALKQALQPAG